MQFNFMRGGVAGLSAFLMLLAISVTVSAATKDGKALFPSVPIYDTATLYEDRANVVVVDVRSQYEFDTLHVKGAEHVDLSTPGFENKIRALQEQSGKKIIFYCNGTTCLKSFRAGKRCMESNIPDIFVYAEGILVWATSHPAETELLGSQMHSVDELISKEEIDQHFLSFDDFAKLVDESETLDVRSTGQRTDHLSLFPIRDRHISLDDPRLEKIIDRATAKGKTILFYDDVGKQVKWLAYRLKKKGVKDFYFLKGGARGFYQKLSDDNR